MKFKRITTVGKANNKGGKRTSIPQIVVELFSIDDDHKEIEWIIDVQDESYTVTIRPVSEE